ncbi:hypothetical protein NQ317_018380 [Molorchus minor]|uniref:Peptidase S1 domain-containing protein n=1 Tax=Molorchus minor TaxID=1323400 RepID=A0ABQ9JGG4_9CUCU|nr:hypothetical protein NQ317_018380 [Molorchus minor]
MLQRTTSSKSAIGHGASVGRRSENGEREILDYQWKTGYKFQLASEKTEVRIIWRDIVKSIKYLGVILDDLGTLDRGGVWVLGHADSTWKKRRGAAWGQNSSSIPNGDTSPDILVEKKIYIVGTIELEKEERSRTTRAREERWREELREEGRHVNQKDGKWSKLGNHLSNDRRDIADEGYNGNIQLVQSKEKVVEDIMHQRPVLYRVLFPAWTGIPPKITKIFVNGELICSGPKIAVGLVPVLTTINLQHTLRIDVQPLVSSSDSFVPPRPPPSNINFIPSEDGPDGRMGGNPKRPNIGNRFDFNPIPPGGPKPPRSDPPPPSSTGPDGRMGNPKRSSFGNDGFDFDPIPHGRSKPPRSDPPLPPSAGGVINNVDFNPQLPNDPSQIYPGNPFFSSSPAANSPGRNDLFDNGQGSFKFFDNSQQPERTTAPTKPTTQRAVVTTRRTAVPNIVKTTPINKDIDLTSKGGTSSGRPYDDICGQSVTTNSLVVNGTTVPRGAYPWLVALFGVKPTGLNYMCSASLISDRHVVTAAHCVRTETRKLRPQDLLVILGKLNIQKWVPVNGEKMIEPESIHIHPDYDTMSSDADIAILILSETV